MIAVPAEVERQFQETLDHHQHGRAAEAERGYLQILAVEPTHFAALQNLGVLRAQQGRLDQALELMRAAVDHHPDLPEGHSNLGAVLRTLNRYEEAMGSYEKALALQPNYADAHNNLGYALQLLNRLDEAEARYRQGLHVGPDHLPLMGNLAYVMILRRRYEDASALYDQILARRPDNPEALGCLGYVRHAQGRQEEAVGHLQRAIALKPDYAEAFNNLGNALAALGRVEEGIAAYKRALLIKPDYYIVPYNIGNALQQANRVAEAPRWYEAALKLKPDYAEAFHNMGTAFLTLDKPTEAIEWYRKAIGVAPHYVDAHSNLGVGLQALDRVEEAREAYLRALAIKPDHAEAWSNLAFAQQVLGEPRQALESCRRALAVRPDYPDALNNLGIALETLGDIEEARRAFERALDLWPHSGKYFRNLAECMTFKPGAPQIARGEALEARVESLSPNERMELFFGLGKMRADLKDYQGALRHFMVANRMKRQQTGYGEATTLAFQKRLRGIFDKDAMSRATAGDPSAAPIFILGMPRSGSTLVEQILASHSEVYGGGELGDFANVMAEVLGHDRSNSPELSRLAILTDVECREIGRRYLASVTKRAGNEAARITDKMPSNFFYVGLIHLALPGARIIHTRRDPVDTCMSCFSKLFQGAQPYSYELGELGRYYRSYLDHMEHWRQALPEGVMLEVDYETLVADTETEARRIIAHAGLPWEEACLAFHKTERPILTASAAQVREPIYKGAIGRWRSVGPLLDPLLQALSL